MVYCVNTTYWNAHPKKKHPSVARWYDNNFAKFAGPWRLWHLATSFGRCGEDHGATWSGDGWNIITTSPKGVVMICQGLPRFQVRVWDLGSKSGKQDLFFAGKVWIQKSNKSCLCQLGGYSTQPTTSNCSVVVPNIQWCFLNDQGCILSWRAPSSTKWACWTVPPKTRIQSVWLGAHWILQWKALETVQKNAAMIFRLTVDMIWHWCNELAQYTAHMLLTFYIAIGTLPRLLSLGLRLHQLAQVPNSGQNPGKNQKDERPHPLLSSWGSLPILFFKIPTSLKVASFWWSEMVTILEPSIDCRFFGILGLLRHFRWKLMALRIHLPLSSRTEAAQWQSNSPMAWPASSRSSLKLGGIHWDGMYDMIYRYTPSLIHWWYWYIIYINIYWCPFDMGHNETPQIYIVIWVTSTFLGMNRKIRMSLKHCALIKDPSQQLPVNFPSPRITSRPQEPRMAGRHWVSHCMKWQNLSDGDTRLREITTQIWILKAAVEAPEESEILQLPTYFKAMHAGGKARLLVQPWWRWRLGGQGLQNQDPQLVKRRLDTEFAIKSIPAQSVCDNSGCPLCTFFCHTFLISYISLSPSCWGSRKHNEA